MERQPLQLQKLLAESTFSLVNLRYVAACENILTAALSFFSEQRWPPRHLLLSP